MSIRFSDSPVPKTQFAQAWGLPQMLCYMHAAHLKHANDATIQSKVRCTMVHTTSTSLFMQHIVIGNQSSVTSHKITKRTSGTEVRFSIKSFSVNIPGPFVCNLQLQLQIHGPSISSDLDSKNISVERETCEDRNILASVQATSDAVDL